MAQMHHKEIDRLPIDHQYQALLVFRELFEDTDPLMEPHTKQDPSHSVREP